MLREKVKAGLETCTKQGTCTGCPYEEGNECITVMLRDAKAYITELENALKERDNR